MKPKPRSTVFGALWIGSEFLLNGKLFRKETNGFYIEAHIPEFGSGRVGWPLDVKTPVQLTSNSRTKY